MEEQNDDKSKLSSVALRKKTAWYVSESEVEAVVRYLRDPTTLAVKNDELTKITDIINLPNGIDKYRSKWLVLRLLTVKNRFESDSKHDLRAKFNWIFYHILVQDNVTLIDEAVVLIFKKNIVQICAGEPKRLSYVCLIDKGFIENKQEPTKSIEYSPSQDVLIASKLESLMLEYEEKRRLEIECQGIKLSELHNQERVAIKSDIKTSTKSLTLLAAQENDLDDDIEKLKQELELIRQKKIVPQVNSPIDRQTFFGASAPRENIVPPYPQQPPTYSNVYRVNE